MNLMEFDEDIEANHSEVTAFVDSAIVCLPDLENARAVVQQFCKLAVYFHQSQKGAHRPLKVLTDCATRCEAHW
ncbi:LOW QUALITY PROTEIN: hypothetical protein PHMEG_00018277 [Phytophthora megakarya]|uniref:Uncharacterized protein n=1 Tax=Phytophthora megakarya TaxID=4795 RepID=A0A225VWZ6_9STRA|nr:LOW QUALITY PROTEIN: hypothetical protein PHMEG_00018277 [Phytophthora megakarya]